MRLPGCFAFIICVVVASGIGGLINPETGAAFGFGVGVLVSWIFFPKRNKIVERTCEICLSPIIHQGYSGTLNGKKFKNICAKCKNKVTDTIRKKRMQEIYGEEQPAPAAKKRK
jgi:hypothetical protein